MQNEEMRVLESELDIELPGVYRDFLLSYPENLLQTSVPNFELLNDAKELICLNREVERSHMNEWNSSFFVIGSSGCGDYYAIDVDEPDGEVYFWNHELGRVELGEGSLTIEEHAGRMLIVYESVQEFYMRRNSTKSYWWQFWKK